MNDRLIGTDLNGASATLLSEALVHALGAADIALETLDWGNYPSTEGLVREKVLLARKLAKEALKLASAPGVGDT